MAQIKKAFASLSIFILVCMLISLGASYAGAKEEDQASKAVDEIALAGNI